MTQTPRINLYEVRDFGANISATFDFLRQNFAVFFKFLTYFMLPVSLVQSLAMNSLMGFVSSAAATASADEGIMSLAVVPVAGTAAAYFVGVTVLMSLVFALIRAYADRPQGLAGITFAELRPRFWHGVWQVVKMYFVSVLLVMVVFSGLPLIQAGLAVMAAYAIVVLAWMVPMVLWPAACLLDDGPGVFAALSKAQRLGWRTWGTIAAVMVVVGVLVNVFQTVCAMPFYIGLAVKIVLGIDGDIESAGLMALNFANYLFGVVLVFGSYVAMVVYAVASAMLYGHAAEKVDHVSMDDYIENFDNL